MRWPANDGVVITYINGIFHSVPDWESITHQLQTIFGHEVRGSPSSMLPLPLRPFLLLLLLALPLLLLLLLKVPLGWSFGLQCMCVVVSPWECNFRYRTAPI